MYLRMPEIPGVGIHALYGIILQVIAHHVVLQSHWDSFPGLKKNLFRIGDSTAQMGDLLG